LTIDKSVTKNGTVKSRFRDVKEKYSLRFSGKVLKYFLLSRLLVVFSVLAGSRFFPTNNSSGIWNIQIPFFNLFARWDSAMYVIIAKSGYSMDSTLVFRPLFPLTMKLGSLPLSLLLYDDARIIVAGFFLNALFFLIALLIIHHLTLSLFSEEIADTTVLLLAFCPAAIFFSAIYAEPLFLLLIALTFLLLEKGSVLGSGVSGFLAGLTRPEGMFTLIPIFIKRISQRSKRREKVIGIVSCLIAFSSLLAILLLAWVVKGNPLVIFSVEFTWDKVTLLTAFNHPTWIWGTGFAEFYFFSIPALVICTLALSYFFANNWKNLRENNLLPYFGYTVSLFLFYLWFGDIRSITRFIWVLIPLYWVLSIWATRKKSLKIAIFSFFSVQLIVGSILFANWYAFQ
jgi:Gpi18-like mannosyltransferase